jgi:hypothetical protein
VHPVALLTSGDSAMKVIEQLTYKMVEDEEYNVHFARVDGSNIIDTYNLYEVVVYDLTQEAHRSPVYVLAESVEGALSQASCLIKGFASLPAEQQRVFKERSGITQVPMMIRGWSDKIF